EKREGRARPPVSILSRPEGREPLQRRGGRLLRDTDVSILSRPEGREPHTLAISECSSARAFQSSPAPKGGSHAGLPLRPAPGAPRFNPLPPRRAGATLRSSS